ncbi:hypothetical protein ACFU5N_00605 [Streptomyces albidoflavus]
MFIRFIGKEGSSRTWLYPLTAVAVTLVVCDTIVGVVATSRADSTEIPYVLREFATLPRFCEMKVSPATDHSGPTESVRGLVVAGVGQNPALRVVP